MDNETNHYSKINKSNVEEKFSSLPKSNNFSLSLLYMFPQISYNQINQDFFQNNLAIQNVRGGASTFHSITLSSSKQKGSKYIYQYNDEYSNYDKVNKAAYNDNSSFLKFKLNDKVFN